MSYLDKEYLISLGNMDPELKAFLDEHPLPKMNYNNVNDFKEMARNRIIDSIESLGPPSPEIKQTELQYLTADGASVRAKLYQPTNPPQGGSPLIVMYHGGGFCTGGPESEEQSCRNFVHAFQAVCVSVEYRQAPEFPFPYAVKDSWDALKWAAENATSWGADTSVGFVIGGTSAGGNITAVLSHLARDEKLSPPLTGQHLVVPRVLPETVVPDKYKEYYLSYEQNRFVSVLSSTTVDLFMRCYNPDDNDAVLYAVFNHPKGHANLPPAVFQIDGMDPLRDEAIIYERVLRQDYGIKTKMYMYPGLPHAHYITFPFLNASDKFRKEQVEGMGWLLGKVPDFSRTVTRIADGGSVLLPPNAP